jgi:hypothetical protein
MEMVKKMLAALGVVLWVGALSPEVLFGALKACIFNENGNELDVREAYDFMEAYFYGDEPIEVDFRFAIVDYLGGVRK